MILQSEDTYLQINVAERSYPNSSDYWDGNWLESEIKLKTSKFKGIYSTNLRADDFQRFYEAIEKLSSNLVKEIEFTTMEEGLYLKGKLNTTGNVQWKGIAKSDTEGSCLTFFFETDNTSIGKLAKEVKEVLKKYPVVGSIS